MRDWVRLRVIDGLILALQAITPLTAIAVVAAVLWIYAMMATGALLSLAWLINIFIDYTFPLAP